MAREEEVVVEGGSRGEMLRGIVEGGCRGRLVEGVVEGRCCRGLFKWVVEGCVLEVAVWWFGEREGGRQWGGLG